MLMEEWENFSIRIYPDVKSQLRDHVNRRSVSAFAAGDEARDQIDTIAKKDARSSRMRETFLEGMGGLPPRDTPLNAKVTGRLQCEGFQVENIIFESRPDTPVTANLYLPNDLQEPQGAVLHVLGHSAEAKFRDVYQTVCQYLVQAGLIVLVFDPIGQGERHSYYDAETKMTTVKPGTADHEHGGVQCWPLGQWATRYFLHDVIRAVDYMCTRSEIDPTRIGITGVSGGGMQTQLAMLCEPRIVAAAPACFTTNRETKLFSGYSQDAEQIWPGMSALGFDHEDVLLAFAPKPVLILAGTGDFFPIEGTQRTVSRTRRFWGWYGKSDDLQLFEDDCIHSYSVPMAKQAAVFFAKHLLKKEVDVEHTPIHLLDPKQLQCTQSGQVRGDVPHARRIHDENCTYLAELERKRAQLAVDERERKARTWLSRQVYSFRQLGDGKVNARYHRTPERIEGEEMQVQSVLWRSQELLFNHGLVFRHTKHESDEGLPVTLAIWEGGTTRIQPHLDWLREQCGAGRMVLVLDMTGSGPLSPYLRPQAELRQTQRFGMTHKLAMDLFWIGDSLAAMRILDVLRALDMAVSLRGAKQEDLHIYTQGRYSIYPQLAAILDKRLDNLEVVEGFGSVADWVRSIDYETDDVSSFLLPGMLRYLDIE